MRRCDGNLVREHRFDKRLFWNLRVSPESEGKMGLRLLCSPVVAPSRGVVCVNAVAVPGPSGDGEAAVKTL